MIKSLFFKLLFLGIIISISIAVNDTTCNRPGSIAEKINWAGHNCPR